MRIWRRRVRSGHLKEVEWVKGLNDQLHSEKKDKLKAMKIAIYFSPWYGVPMEPIQNSQGRMRKFDQTIPALCRETASAGV